MDATETILTRQQIQEIIPHREPFIFVDRIVDLEYGKRAVGMLDEVKAGAPSAIADDLDASPALTDNEIRERMSGNLCRCAAYPNIVAAIGKAADR